VISRLFRISLAASVTLFAITQKAAAADCTVSIEHLFLNSMGSTQGLYQYQIDVTSTDKAPLAITFVVAGQSAQPSHTVRAAHVDFSKGPKTTLMFPWPSPDIVGISVQNVTTLEDGQTVRCEGAQIPLPHEGMIQSMWRFDDSAVVVKQEMVASILEVDLDQPFGHKESLKYPLAARVQNIQGSAQVAVTVGPDGQILSTWILNSSGSTLLDDAGLQAAQLSTFRKPGATDGQLVAATYIIQYIWRLQP
jgi:TonB family protein